MKAKETIGAIIVALSFCLLFSDSLAAAAIGIAVFAGGVSLMGGYKSEKPAKEEDTL